MEMNCGGMLTYELIKPPVLTKVTNGLRELGFN